MHAPYGAKEATNKANNDNDCYISPNSGSSSHLKTKLLTQVRLLPQGKHIMGVDDLKLLKRQKRNR